MPNTTETLDELERLRGDWKLRGIGSARYLTAMGLALPSLLADARRLREVEARLKMLVEAYGGSENRLFISVANTITTAMSDRVSESIRDVDPLVAPDTSETKIETDG